MGLGTMNKRWGCGESEVETMGVRMDLSRALSLLWVRMAADEVVQGQSTTVSDSSPDGTWFGCAPLDMNMVHKYL